MTRSPRRRWTGAFGSSARTSHRGPSTARPSMRLSWPGRLGVPRSTTTRPPTPLNRWRCACTKRRGIWNITKICMEGMTMSENETGMIRRDQYITRYEPKGFDDLARLSKAVVRSGLAPSDVKSPEDAMMILMTGAELGLTAMQSLRSIYVVKGKPTMAADLMKALVLASGECEKWEYETKSAACCRAIVQRRGSKPQVYEWTIQDARNAGLNSATWKNYPSQMLRHRVDADAARGEFPHLILGMYTPDELGGQDDVDDAPRVVAREEPPARPKESRTEEIVDAEFEEAPAAKRARGNAAKRTETAEFNLEGESVSEKKAWATANAAIHAQAKGLSDLWYRAFHDYITGAVGAPNWNALTVEQLEMVLTRFKRVKDPVAWIKDVARGCVKAPAFANSEDGWREVIELIRAVTRSNEEKTDQAERNILDHYDVAFSPALTIAQTQDIWVELATRSALAPNGGQDGELSEREDWILSLVAADQQVESAALADEELPF